jgi:hypothetical protein
MFIIVIWKEFLVIKKCYNFIMRSLLMQFKTNFCVITKNTILWDFKIEDPVYYVFGQKGMIINNDCLKKKNL